MIYDFKQVNHTLKMKLQPIHGPHACCVPNLQVQILNTKIDEGNKILPSCSSLTLSTSTSFK